MYILQRVILLLLFITIGVISAQDETTFKAQDPVLITSAGQSADVLMAKILATKAGISFELDQMAQPEMLDGKKSLIVVSGGSTKGLGAAKIDKEEEYKRVQKILKAANKQDIPVILLHVGGKSRRGALSDYFNILVAEHADHLIVVATGNEDGYFTKISETRKIGLDLPEKIVAVQDILKTIYDK